MLDVTPNDAPYLGLWYFIEGGNLYLEARHEFASFWDPTINTIGQRSFSHSEGFYNRERRLLRYQIDTAQLGLDPDWTANVYWLVEAPAYFILMPAAFIEARREPAKRKNIVVGGAPPAIGYVSDGAR